MKAVVYGGYCGAAMAGAGPGDTVAVFGAGPVGYQAHDAAGDEHPAMVVDE